MFYCRIICQSYRVSFKEDINYIQDNLDCHLGDLTPIMLHTSGSITNCCQPVWKEPKDFNPLGCRITFIHPEQYNSVFSLAFWEIWDWWFDGSWLFHDSHYLCCWMHNFSNMLYQSISDRLCMPNSKSYSNCWAFFSLLSGSARHALYMPVPSL